MGTNPSTTTKKPWEGPQGSGDHILLVPSSRSPSPQPSRSTTTTSLYGPTGADLTRNNLNTDSSGATTPVAMASSDSAVGNGKDTNNKNNNVLTHRQQQPTSDSSYLYPSTSTTSTAANSSTGNHYTPASSVGQDSKASILFHKTVLSPLQTASHFTKKHTPPWVFPRYRGRKPLIRSTILGPLCRMMTTILILGVLMLLTILYSFRENQPQPADYEAVTTFNWTIDPSSYLSPMNITTLGGTTYDILLDGHSHTTYSDGRMTPESSIKWHIANGYNAMVVSDHNTIEGGLAAVKIAQEKYAGKMIVIPAMELSCCRIHMNLIGINETIDYAITKNPTNDQLKATIARTHELGGLAICNHIPWSNSTEYGYPGPKMPLHPSREELVEMGIDGFEVLNGQTLDTISLQFVQDHNLLIMSGSDIHYPDNPAYGWTVLNTHGNKTADSIMTELRARRTSFLFDPVGTQPLSYPPASQGYDQTAAPTLLGQYFQMFWVQQTGLYSFMPTGGFCQPSYTYIQWGMIWWFIAWCIVGFLIFEAVRMLIMGCWGMKKRRAKYLRQQKMLSNSAATMGPAVATVATPLGATVVPIGGSGNESDDGQSSSSDEDENEMTRSGTLDPETGGSRRRHT